METNEPVAWMVEDDEDISFIMNGKGLAKPDVSWKSVIPLYTHSAKTLLCACGEPSALNTVHRKDSPCFLKEELTDEEIEQEATVHQYVDWFDSTSFARAILRKAQEK